VTLQPATLLLIKSAATTALGFPTSDLLQSAIKNFVITNSANVLNRHNSNFCKLKQIAHTKNAVYNNIQMTSDA